MILVDTGPLVALFDPKDGDHELCRKTLAKLKGPLRTTVPVLVEAFHLLQPESLGSRNLRRFVLDRGLSVWFMDDEAVVRAFALMEDYSDQPMDLADASLVVAAEKLRTRSVFTLDERDFRTYRVRIGHKQERLRLVP
jgi:predicted nucleic acid-binding protein